MYRKPQIKDQARILAKEFEAHGVKMAHRQALDVLARINGHASWQVMENYEKTHPSAPVAPAAVPAPAVAPRIKRDKVYVFEAMGFVESREILDKLKGDYSGDLSAELKSKMEALGFYSFCRVDISEDDNQDDEDIKVFITIRLVGPGMTDVWENELSFDACAFFDEVAALVCEDDQGCDQVGPESWEFVDAESF